jgi:electron transfer flavoprotein alpha subunit
MGQDVVFFAEQRGGAFRSPAFESAGVARTLADAFGGKAHGIVIGESVASIAGELGRYGADAVHVVDDPSLKLYAPRAYAGAVAETCRSISPGTIIFATTAMGRDLAPRVAAHLGAGYAPDCIEVAAADGNRPRVVRPMYAGKVRASFSFTGDAPAVVGIRPNTFAPREEAREATTHAVAFSADESALADRVIEVKVETDGKIDLSEARIVVSGGRGMKGPDNFGIVQKLADALGGAMGASRAAVDAGWIDHSHQVGQTGRTVSPDLYVACGISGAIQHLAGMSSSRVLVAINKDPEAPIFKVADYGVVGDLFEIVPLLTEKVREMKAG